MNRCPFALLLASAVAAIAQPDSPPKAAVPSAPNLRPRAISPAAATLLNAALPKVAPVKPAATNSAGPSSDVRDVDKPQNTIVRLPQFVVREARPPIFREQDLYREQDLARRLAKRYYSEGYLAFSRLIHYTPLALVLPSAEASALQQFYDDERLRNMADVADNANMLMKSNPAAGAKMKYDAQQTFMHWSDLGWSNKPK